MGNQHYRITRCPHCNSTDLSAFYQQEHKRQGLLAWCFRWSIFGLIKHFLEARKEDAKIKANIYWQCNRCGATFAVDDK